MQKAKRIIFDGNHLLHRVLHANLKAVRDNRLAPEPSEDDRRRYVGGVFGFIESMRKEIGKLDPDSALVVFDKGLSERRLSLHPEYKQRFSEEERTESNEDFVAAREYRDQFLRQLSILIQIIPMLGVKLIQLPGREADDVIGLIARYLSPRPVVIVTEDADMLQLIEVGINIFRPMQDRMVTTINFEREIGHPLDRMLLLKSVLGEPKRGDNIPGIEGVGYKTALQVATGSPSTAWGDVYDFCAGHASKRVRKVSESFHTVKRNEHLVDISKEIFTQSEIDTMRDALGVPRRFDDQGILELFTTLKFQRPLDSWDSWTTPFVRLLN